MALLSLWRAERLGLLFLLVAGPVVAQVPPNLCANFNTADGGRNTSIYQSNGLCSTMCQNDFAYAVTQAQSCWCSDFTPDKLGQVDLADCDVGCPGFPDEKCGGRGLFGYVELNGHLPSGTRGPDQASTTAALPTTTAKVTKTETVQATITVSSSETSTTTRQSTSSPPLETITDDGGSIITVTVGPTGGAGNGGGGGGGGSLNTGAIVGIVVGVLALVGIAGGIALFFFLKRRKRNQEDGYQNDPSVRADSSDRIGSAHPEMSTAAGSPGAGAHASNRNSTLQIDPRMDPFKQGLYVRGSHESINTIRDEQDYSRRILRATNPDPDAA